MDLELEQMKQLADELEVPLEQVMLVKATVDWLEIGCVLSDVLKGVFGS